MANNSWATGLIKTLKDPSTHIISSNLAVVISDKYPKAQHHYLVLPHEDIPSIFNLTKIHLALLEELYLLALNVIEVKQQKLENFKIGFHNQPSMQRLHLHVISKDFVSDCLKTKKHWNSFNTALFLNYEDLCQQLQESGKVRRLDSETLKSLSNMDLKCNQCEFVAKNMPTLKQHLLEHLE
ncbi:aprataxin-like protein [Lucilia cuprina]|uniref:aprataxin-like protein n=1 Tax=Lucilia cuprina TaxID=7375 RepID=UPI001F06F843|nr:aprataxin-like protein [Lucilia cuprina]